MRHLVIGFILLSISLFSVAEQADVITFEQTPCYGNCPNFKAYLFADGTFIFDGRDNVKQQGIQKFKLSTSKFEQLHQLLLNANYQQFETYYSGKEQCKQIWSDSPSRIMSIQYAGSAKEIHHYLGCKGFEREQELKQLELDIIEILDIKAFLNNQ